MDPPISLVSSRSFSFEHEQKSGGPMRPSLARRLGHELSKLSQMAGPLFIGNVFSYSSSAVAVGFVGHMGQPVLLSSAVLATSLYNVSGSSILSGLASGMETLCGQAYGAATYKALGLVLQRALLILWLVCLPLSLLWANAQPLLLALGQEPAVAQGAALVLRTIIPTLFSTVLLECTRRYLLAQRVVLPGMVAAILSCCLCPLLNWLLIFRCRLGLYGAALAFMATQLVTALLLLAYTCWRDASMAASDHPQATWQRPGLAAFSGWWRYLTHAVPAAVMLCMEWWAYEVVIFMSGTMRNAEVAVGVMGVAFQISTMAYMAAMAYGSSVNTRVSNKLGAGQASAAKLATFTGLAAVVVVEGCIALAVGLARRQVAGLLSSSQEVIDLTVEVLPIILPTFISDSINCVAMSVLRAAGRQGLGAAMNVTAYWIVGVPMSALFGLRWGGGVKGLWLGLLVTSATQSLVQLTMLSCWFDWQREVERAAELVAEHEREVAEAKAAALAAAAAAAAGSGSGSGGAMPGYCAVGSGGSAAESLLLDSDSGAAGRDQGPPELEQAGLLPRRDAAGRPGSSSSSSSTSGGGRRHPQQQGPSRFAREARANAGSSSSGWWQRLAFWRQQHSRQDLAMAMDQQQQQQQAAARRERLPLLPAAADGQQPPRQLQPQLSIQKALLQPTASMESTCESL